MKTFKQFIFELTQSDLDTETSSLNKKSQELKKTTPVNKPNFDNSQSEPKAPTNIAPAVASAANQATGGYGGMALNTARSTVMGGTKQVIRGALGGNRP